MATSQNGFKANTRSLIKSYKVPGGQIAMRKGAVATVLIYVAERFHNEVENLRWPGNWGYAERPIRGATQLSNHCVTGDVEVVTADGVESISKLAGTTARVLTRDPSDDDERGCWVDAPVSYFGDEETVVVTLGRGQVQRQIRATRDHRWFIDRRTSQYVGNYQSEYVVKHDEKTTAELAVGDRLAACLPEVANPGLDPAGVAHGVVFGDGTYHPQGSTFVRLWGVKQQLDLWLPQDCRRSSKHLDSGAGGVEVRGLNGGYKQRPHTDAELSYLGGWLAGYVATDGSTSGGELTLSSVCRDDLVFAADVATRLGIATRPIGAGQLSKTGFAVNTVTYSLSFVWQTVPDWLLIRDDQSIPPVRSRRSKGWKVLAVESSGLTEPVYCATVNGYGAFTLADWILTGNSSGTAIDLNAPQHPLGTQPTANFSGKQIRTIRQIVADCDGVVRWGGDYRGRKDGMHFEINASMARVKKLARKIKSGDTGKTKGRRTMKLAQKKRSYKKPQKLKDRKWVTLKVDPNKKNGSKVISVTMPGNHKSSWLDLVAECQINGLSEGDRVVVMAYKKNDKSGKTSRYMKRDVHGSEAMAGESGVSFIRREFRWVRKPGKNSRTRLRAWASTSGITISHLKSYGII